MALKMNLGEEQAWNLSGDSPVEDGWHLAIVNEAKEGESQAGNPTISFTFGLLGAYEGRERWDTLPILPPDPANGRKGNLGKVRAVLEAMGRAIPKGEFALDAATLQGARVGILLETKDETYQGETRARQRVRGYKHASEFAGDDLAAGLASKMGATAVADDDIPF